MNEYRWADLGLGLGAEFSAAITPAMMTAFADMSGDLNPLHIMDGFAAERGFQGRVVYGLLTSALYSRLVGMHLPGKWGVLHGIDVEFKAPAYVGDLLTVSGTVQFLNEAYRRIEIKARIVNQSGAVISKANIRAGLHDA